MIVNISCDLEKERKMKLIVVVLIGAVVAVSAQLDFKSFKLSNHKAYKNGAEEGRRMKIFNENAKKVAEHNKRFAKGEVTYEKGLNEFSDMSEEEFNSAMTGFVPELEPRSKSTVYHKVPKNAKIPKSIDWRRRGAVTGVKRQSLGDQKCGSCWIFGSIGALEGAYFLKYGKLKSFSEQNVLDCSRPNYDGCRGGTWTIAYDFIKRNNGISTNTVYPYVAKKGQCQAKQKDKRAKVQRYVRIKDDDEKALTHAIATVGPVAVSIDATNGLKDHKSGTYYKPNCTSKRNHLVLAVGYGTDKNGDYYIIKNSWGPNWAENGYFKMARNRNNNCAIASHAGYPIL